MAAPPTKLYTAYEAEDTLGNPQGGVAAFVMLYPPQDGSTTAMPPPGSSASNPMFVSSTGGSSSVMGTVAQGAPGTQAWAVGDAVLAGLLLNATGTGTLAMGTAGTQAVISNPSNATLRVHITGLTASGGTIAFYAGDATGDTLFAVGGISGAANTRYTVAAADGSYTFDVAARARIVLQVATTGTGSATFAWTAGPSAGVVTLDTSPVGPAFVSAVVNGASVSVGNPLPTSISNTVTVQDIGDRVTLAQTQVPVPANASTQLLAANPSRKSLRISGTNAADSFRLGYGVAASGTSSALFGSGGIFTAEQYGPGDGCPTNAIFAFATTAFTAQVGEGT